MRDGGDWEAMVLKYHFVPDEGTKHQPLPPAWHWTDKVSHPASQSPRMREGSLLPGVFIPLIRPNNGTITCWGLLWCQGSAAAMNPLNVT